jgi:hypothetical protein
MIIGITGLIGSGKGTVGDILVDYHNFKKISFADKLKDGCAAIFGWERDLLEGDTDRSRIWREKPDAFWTKEFGREITPRYVLQLMGTECMRKGFHEDIWALLAKKEMTDNPHMNYVIPDVRFPNEMQLIRELNGEVWNIRRGTLPSWWEDAIKSNNHSEGFPMSLRSDVHPSEWSWVCEDNGFDAIIRNDGTLEQLYSRVEEILSK